MRQPDEAKRWFTEAGHMLSSASGTANPAVAAWRSGAALADAMLGDQLSARRLAEEELKLARRFGATRPLADALRAAGVVRGGEAGLALLQEADELVSDSPVRLTAAKVAASLGRSLRHAGRLEEAREALRRALADADRLGAVLLAERARDELVETGARPRRTAVAGPDALTPSERRVVELAAQGRTNREIAAQLVVTVKAVEYHLNKSYQKLGISSRRELPGILGTTKDGTA